MGTFDHSTLQKHSIELAEASLACADALLTQTSVFPEKERANCENSVSSVKALRQSCEQLSKLSDLSGIPQVVDQYLDHCDRIERENNLLKDILDKEEDRHAAWHRGEFYSELDKRSDTLEKYLHLSYLTGLRRKLIKNATALLLETIEARTNPQEFQAIETLVSWFKKQRQAIKDVASFHTENELHQQRQANNIILGSEANNYQLHAIAQKLLMDIVDLGITSIEKNTKLLDELELVTYLVIAKQLLESGSDLATLANKINQSSPYEGLELIKEQVQELFPGSEQGYQLLAELIKTAPSIKLDTHNIHSYETASLSSSRRLSLAEQIVTLIKESLASGGRFPKESLKVEVINELLNLPDSYLHCQFSETGELIAILICHFGDYPEPFTKYKAYYNGSLDDGLLRLIAIHPNYQGTSTYDQLETRALLNAVGTVDYLFGALEVGANFNFKGIRHLKAGHQPVGSVERRNDGSIYQHLIMPVSYNLRTSFELSKPKGYLPSVHRRIGDKLYQRTSENPASYTTSSLPKIYYQELDPQLVDFMYVPDDFISKYYTENPEPIDPRHLLYRLRN